MNKNSDNSKENIVTIKGFKAIKFHCENCGALQYADYSLEPDREDDRAVNSDNIDCNLCGHTNRVIEEL